MNLTLFLGAGFSAPFGHPVMDTFLGFADSCERLTDDDRLFLGGLVLEARRANSFLESSPTNLEDILTFSEMGDRLGLVKKSENRSQRFLKIVQKIYTTTPPAKEYWDRYAALEKLVGSKLDEFKGKLTFVTTNYDLNIESACVSLRTQTNPGFPLVQVQSGEVQSLQNLYETSGIPLFKLHGSVNWYISKKDSSIEVENRIVAVMGNFDGKRQLRLPYPCAGNYSAPGDPLIVAPSFLKPDLSKTIGEIWSGAAQALSKSNVVAFVGYSFPSSDTEIAYFLARAFSENSGLRAIYIVNPHADKLVNRLRSSESKMGSHFRSLLNPITANWTDAKLPI